MVIFKYDRLPVNLAKFVPKERGIGKSESGWMTGKTFFEYIANVFYLWLLANDIQMPIILLMDGHTSLLTMELSTFCRNHDII